MPEDLEDTVMEWREKLFEAVAEYDESLLEKFFEIPTASPLRKYVLRSCSGYGYGFVL
jgi:translation elongation factor EF-G